MAEASRLKALTVLHQLADGHGTSLDGEGGIRCAWPRRRGQFLPSAEHFLVPAPVAPDGYFDKDGPGFGAAWEGATATEDDGLPLSWGPV
jgi:hypothetical protein